MSTNKQSGFTIIELIVVVTVLGILIAVVIDTLGSFYTSNTTTISRTVQSTDTTSVLRTIESSITTSSGFLPITSMPVTTPLGFDNDNAPWTYKGFNTSKQSQNPSGDNNRVLISKQYVTNKPLSDPTRALVYPTSSGCATPTGAPASYNLIFFVKQDPTSGSYNLYRRTILPTDALCTAAFQKQTCAPAASGAACQGKDAMLLDKVDSFTIDYYSSATSQTPIVDQYGAADITTAKSIKITVITKRLIDGRQQPETSTIRITRLN